MRANETVAVVSTLLKTMIGRGSSRPRSIVVGLAALIVGFGAVGTGQVAAIGTSVPLGAAESFAVLGAESVTNTGPSVITGDLGVSPGTSITGFPPGIVYGTFHAADSVALQAQTDLVAAYDDAAGQAPDASVSGDLGGLTLVPGVYNAASSIGLTGTLTLDAGGDPDAVWVFQIGSELTTASGSAVSLINGAQACNVVWQIGSSATLDVATSFVGDVLALISITANTGATVDGRLLARTGSVTLDSNIVTRSTCLTEPGPTTTTTTTTPDDATTTTSPVDSGSTTIGGPTTTINPTEVTLPSTGQSEANGAAVVAATLLVVGLGIVVMSRRRTDSA